jgi:hypothetical protein
MWRVAVVGGIIGVSLGSRGDHNHLIKVRLHEGMVNTTIGARMGTTFCFVNGLVRAAKRERDKAVPKT